jgi:CRISP-associated protein Cas1
MGTLVLDRSNLELRADGQAIAVYENGERSGTVPVNLLERVILQGSIRLETGVLTRLAEAGVATLLLSPRHARRMAMLLGPGHNDAVIRIGQYRAALDAEFGAHWSQSLVRAKVRGQLAALRQSLGVRPDCRKPITDAGQTLQDVLHQLRARTPIIETVRGLEGGAAAAYFRGYQALFPESLEFTGRNRRPPRDPVNAVLSLGYTLLHFDAVRAAHVTGLDPLIGFYHGLAYGRESLACDLIEPLRPRLDLWVWRLFADRTLRAEHFSRDKDACLLGKAGRGHFYQAYDAFAHPLRRQLRRECALLVRLLRGRSALSAGHAGGQAAAEETA